MAWVSFIYLLLSGRLIKPIFNRGFMKTARPRRGNLGLYTICGISGLAGLVVGFIYISSLYDRAKDNAYKEGYRAGLPKHVVMHDLDSNGTTDILLYNDNQEFTYLCPGTGNCELLDRAEIRIRTEADESIKLWRTGIEQKVAEIVNAGE